MSDETAAGAIYYASSEIFFGGFPARTFRRCANLCSGWQKRLIRVKMDKSRVTTARIPRLIIDKIRSFSVRDRQIEHVALLKIGKPGFGLSSPGCASCDHQLIAEVGNRSTSLSARYGLQF